MSKKYIFLDIDGVLNSYIGLELHCIIDNDIRLTYCWNNLCMNNLIALKLLLKNCPNEVKLILNTSWRNLEDLREAFIYLHIRRWDYTLIETYNKKTNLLKYLNDNNIPYDDIVIIDDEDYLKDIEDIHNRLVKINPHDGLTYSDSVKVCNLLGLKMHKYTL